MQCAMLHLNPRAASSWRLSASPASFESSSGTGESTWIWMDPSSTHPPTGTMACLSSTLWPTGGAFRSTGTKGSGSRSRPGEAAEFDNQVQRAYPGGLGADLSRDQEDCAGV